MLYLQSHDTSGPWNSVKYHQHAAVKTLHYVWQPLHAVFIIASWRHHCHTSNRTWRTKRATKPRSHTSATGHSHMPCDVSRDPRLVLRPWISLCTDIAHEKKKIAGLPQIWILTPSLWNLTRPNFCIQAYTSQGVCSTSREKRTSKHDISMIIISQYWMMEKGCISGSSVWEAAFIGKFLSLKLKLRLWLLPPDKRWRLRPLTGYCIESVAIKPQTDYWHRIGGTISHEVANDTEGGRVTWSRECYTP